MKSKEGQKGQKGKSWQGRSRASSVNTSAMSSVVSSAYPSRASSPAPKQPFRFFDLPAELRLRIYEMLLHLRDPLDLDSMNYRLVLPRLALFLVSKRMHEESYRVFYAQTIRLFPNPHGRFFHTKKPLLARLPLKYREAVNTMELRLGPGWSNPPKCQCAPPTLGLADCTNLRMLKIFVELDPSDSVFTGFRGKNATEETYKWFCVDLLQSILSQVPSIEAIEIDAYPSVKKDAPLVMGLRRVIDQAHLKLTWGPLRGWEKDGDEPGLIGLEKAMAGMALGGALTVIQVNA